MRRAKIFFKKEEAGLLTQLDDGSFVFSYHDAWIEDSIKPAISLVLPKDKQVYKSPYLFPTFFHLLPEGSNKNFVCKALRIDEEDDFGILLATAKVDTIGAIRVVKIE